MYLRVLNLKIQPQTLRHYLIQLIPFIQVQIITFEYEPYILTRIMKVGNQAKSHSMCIKSRYKVENKYNLELIERDSIDRIGKWCPTIECVNSPTMMSALHSQCVT